MTRGTFPGVFYVPKCSFTSYWLGPFSAGGSDTTRMRSKACWSEFLARLKTTDIFRTDLGGLEMSVLPWTHNCIIYLSVLCLEI